MPKKTQSVSRSAQRDAGVESRSNGDGATNRHRPDENSNGIHARISKQAYALYEEHGRKDGRDLEDWLAAEQQVLNRV